MEKRRWIFTFANHMHWIDMEWMWGEGTLANSLRDMFCLIDETGARGALNFDAIGYEYLVLNEPDLMRETRERLKSGQIELVSGSYTQPYGHLCGEESNIRQLLQGIRSCEKTLCVVPLFWWEEEFSFFPQMPQILNQFGYNGASLFFQETWHTPYIPLERSPVIQWKGPDGSSIKTLSRTKTCIHQWPEDLQRLLEEEKSEERVVVQWLELMDSKKWMCRSELIAPELKELSRKGWNLDFRLPTTIIEEARPEITRDYGLYDFYQGISLGKNGDVLRSDTRKCEYEILDGQTLAVTHLIVGRDYPQWSEYPDWEFREVWKDLMISQAHDIDECEGFCGDIGKQYLKKALAMSRDITSRYLSSLSRHVGEKGVIIAYNPLHWNRREHVSISGEREFRPLEIDPGPGVCVAREIDAPEIEIYSSDEGIELRWYDTSYLVDSSGRLISKDRVLAELSSCGSRAEHLSPLMETRLSAGLVRVEASVKAGQYVLRIIYDFDSLKDFVEVECEIEAPSDPVPGYKGCLFLDMYSANEKLKAIRSDYPFGEDRGMPSLKVHRKYPTGDWMTSDKHFEMLENPFTGLRYARAEYEKTALNFLGKGTQGFFRTDNGFRAALYLYDPWDGSNWSRKANLNFALTIESPDGQPERMAMEFNRPLRCFRSSGDGGVEKIVPVSINGQVFVSGMYIEGGKLYLRLWSQSVETEKATIETSLNVTRAELVDLMQKKLSELEFDTGRLELDFKPFEIKTLALTLEKQQVEGIDSYRKVWAEQRLEGWREE